MAKYKYERPWDEDNIEWVESSLIRDGVVRINRMTVGRYNLLFRDHQSEYIVDALLELNYARPRVRAREVSPSVARADALDPGMAYSDPARGATAGRAPARGVVHTRNRFICSPRAEDHIAWILDNIPRDIIEITKNNADGTYIIKSRNEEGSTVQRKFTADELVSIGFARRTDTAAAPEARAEAETIGTADGDAMSAAYAEDGPVASAATAAVEETPAPAEPAPIASSGRVAGVPRVPPRRAPVAPARYLGAPKAEDHIEWVEEAVPDNIISITANIMRAGTYNVKDKDNNREILTVDQLIERGYARRVEPAVAAPVRPSPAPAARPAAPVRPAPAASAPAALAPETVVEPASAVVEAVVEAAVDAVSTATEPGAEPASVESAAPAAEPTVEAAPATEPTVEAAPAAEPTVEAAPAAEIAPVAEQTPAAEVVAMAEEAPAEAPAQEAAETVDTAFDPEPEEDSVEEAPAEPAAPDPLQQLMDTYNYATLLAKTPDELTDHWRSVVDGRNRAFVALDGTDYTDACGKDKVKVMLTVQTLKNFALDFQKAEFAEYGALYPDAVFRPGWPMPLSLAKMQQLGLVSPSLAAATTLFFVLDNGHAADQQQQLFVLDAAEKAMFFFDPSALPFFGA